MAKYSRKSILEEKRFLDKETGEICSIPFERTVIVRQDKDTFFQHYTGIMGILYGIKPDGAVKLLSWMMANMQSLTNEVLITPQRREQICKELGISQAVYYVYLNSLLESKVVAGKRGNYIISPELAWYGNTKQRENMIDGIRLRMEALYSEEFDERYKEKK